MSSVEQNPGSEILDLINKARLVMEMPALKKLPRGIPETSRKCVLGRSLGLEILLDDQDRPYALVHEYRRACRLARVWSVGRPYGMWNGWAMLLPDELSKFVHEFDSRCYPQLLSVSREQKSGVVRSELRSLRFDWVEENKKVADLLERARAAHDAAQD